MARDPQRHDLILQELRKSRFEALASFSSTEVLLLTGYWPVMGASLAICTRDGIVYAIIPEDELEIAQATSDAHFFTYQPATLHQLIALPEVLLDPIKTVADMLQLNPGEIGVDLSCGAQGSSYPSVSHFRLSILPLLRKCFPQLTAVSADSLFTRLMSIKTDVEIEILRRICQKASVGFCEARRAIAAGRREDQIAADIESAFSSSANNGFERSRGYFFCMSGLNAYKASGAYARTRSRTLEDGDLVMVHANTVGDGYWADISRTWVVGVRNKKQESMYDAIGAARQAALDAVLPGESAAKVDAAARSVLTGRGFGPAYKHSTGHGVGFTAADANALPRLHPASSDILEAGMTFNIEPAIYLEGVGGMRHCDVVACTHDGVEVLTDF